MESNVAIVPGPRSATTLPRLRAQQLLRSLQSGHDKLLTSVYGQSCVRSSSIEDRELLPRTTYAVALDFVVGEQDSTATTSAGLAYR